MEQFLTNFFRRLLDNKDDLSSFVNELYDCGEYTEDELNQIFGLLKQRGLLSCFYADNRAYNVSITISGLHYFDSTLKNPRLIELINALDKIEKEFHNSTCSGLPEIQLIYDSQMFQDWIQELLFELESIKSDRKDSFICETIELLKRKFNGFDDKKLFSEIKAKLRVIKNNKEKYLCDVKPDEVENTMPTHKLPLIFISHSSNNKKHVELIADLLTDIGLEPQKDVFCSSVTGYDIPIDENIFNFLRDKFNNNKIHVFIIHSHEYYKSSICMNEMGAAWILNTECTSLLLPGFNYSDMNGIINGQNIGIKFDNDIIEVKDKLNQLKEMLEKEFSIEPIKNIIWEKKRDKFMSLLHSWSIKI